MGMGGRGATGMLTETSLLRVVVADRSPAFAEVLARYLTATGSVAAVSVGVDELGTFDDGQCSVLVLDGDLDRQRLIAAAGAARRATPRLRILLLVDASTGDCETVRRSAGAWGCVSRQATPDAVVQAAVDTHSGRHIARAQLRPVGGADQWRARLTGREVEVLRQIATGRSLPAIGDELGISTTTVKAYLQRAMEKLEVHTRVAAVDAARRANLLGTP